MTKRAPTTDAILGVLRMLSDQVLNGTAQPIGEWVDEHTISRIAFKDGGNILEGRLNETLSGGIELSLWTSENTQVLSLDSGQLPSSCRDLLLQIWCDTVIAHQYGNALGTSFGKQP